MSDNALAYRGSPREQPMLDETALRAIRQILAFALATEGGQSPPRPNLTAVDSRAFLRAARRHRVSAIISNHAAELGLAVDCIPELAQLAANGRLTALKLAAETVETVEALGSVGIRAIAFKGVCLAQQTTGDFAARGAGDVDIWVSPADVARSIDRLSEIGFEQRLHTTPDPGDSWQWRYALWLGYEISLQRNNREVDLHWWLTNIPNALPDFETAWHRRVEVRIGSRDVPSLSPKDALAHSCAHAVKDQWESLRSLVDVYRLLQLTGGTDHPDPPSCARAIALTAEVSKWAFGQVPTSHWPAASTKAIEQALRVAEEQQRRPYANRGGPWSISQNLGWHRHQASVATRPSDYLRLTLDAVLPARALVADDGHTATGAAMGIRSRGRYVWHTFRGLQTGWDGSRARWASRVRTVEAMSLLTCARGLRLAVPMHRWQQLAGCKQAAAASTTPPAPVQPFGVERVVAGSVLRGAFRLHFHTTCLDQALAARWMLRRRGQSPVLIIGLVPGDPDGGAHAWLVGADGGTVTGASAVPQFTPVTEFR